ncbi:hypothetical protein NHE_0465 [Neorickettsia helminthoeca str. Oregon]|uniref:Uncharacterized protein n=1 Tax=Neorickettsia helminthoeca str. Oregon TaxID=1286528 RepID=X5HK09_9RICK|nr:hypothetical protein NHE_0465 [Neorickettsia helminthoeca str. Oregon]
MKVCSIREIKLGKIYFDSFVKVVFPGLKLSYKMLTSA